MWPCLMCNERTIVLVDYGSMEEWPANATWPEKIERILFYPYLLMIMSMEAWSTGLNYSVSTRTGFMSRTLGPW